ncbi:MAG: homoserine kinase [Elusimicrobia bacterium]|nr:homoserine kinase [Elusimicrobiota bacterium]
MKKIKIRIPATTSNFGSGYDVFGAALKLYNEVEVTVQSPKSKVKIPNIEILGEGKDTLPRDKRNIVWQAMKEVFSICHLPAPLSLKRGESSVICYLRLINRIPLARGMGSSAAARVGGLVAANKICGNRLSADEIIRIATKLEGHPDNVVPAYFGGLCICNYDKKNVKYFKLKMPKDLKAVFCIPEFEVSTDKARKLLPKKIPHKDAVFNSGRVALFVSAIIRKEYKLLSMAMEDKLHQPYRKKLIPGISSVFETAVNSGTYGVAVSGSGPSILAISSQRIAGRIGKMMQKAFNRHNIKSRYIVCDFNNKGTSCV